MYWFGFSLISLIGAGLIGATIYLFRARWPADRTPRRQVVLNLAVSLSSLMIILLGIELFFKLIFAQSDAFGFTHASTNWFERYWQENSLGYRDVEWNPQLLAGRTKIMVLGDSFVAGHGINDPANRFSDVLGRLLGEGYAVMNVGQNGASTQDEIRNGLSYPYEPDLIIFAHYLNDIEDTARGAGHKRPAFQPAIAPWLKPWVDNSYALNFLYWRFYRLQRGDVENTYWNWLTTAYDDPQVWQLYQRELLKIQAYGQQRRVRLIVVVFPNLLAIEASRPLTGRIVSLFQERGVPVLDVAGLVGDRPPAELVVNRVDSHPNEFVHRLVAEQLYRLVLETSQAVER
jgi:hypothetical protein